MRPYAGRKIGQTGYELLLSVFFSFFLHAAIIAATLFLYLAAAPKALLPPAYTVRLVGGNAVKGPEPVVTPAAPKQEAKQPEPGPPPKTKAKQKTPKPQKHAKAKPHPGAMPAPTGKTAKPVEALPEKTVAAPAKEQPAAAPAPSAAKAEGKAEGVAVSSASEEFQYAYYLENMRDKIERNWNAPPGVQGVKATVQFTVLRSGRVTDTKLINSSGNFYFDQAAMRAIMLSSPFPSMPDGFYKPSETFSVDLMEKE